MARASPRAVGHALSTPFGALKHVHVATVDLAGSGACPLNALRGTETQRRTRSELPVHGEGHALSTPFGALKRTPSTRFLVAYFEGHALSTPFGALKHHSNERGTLTVRGHALSTPFGALKHRIRSRRALAISGACPLNALRGTETSTDAADCRRARKGHALSTPFGALKPHPQRCGSRVGRRGMPSQRPSGH